MVGYFYTVPIESRIYLLIETLKCTSSVSVRYISTMILMTYLVIYGRFKGSATLFLSYSKIA